MMKACFTLSASNHTRRAYWSDARRWLAFCEGRGVSPLTADAVVVAAWVEDMKTEGSAPKTRLRRLAALSSIYDRIRRDSAWKTKLDGNPFSIAEGPERERPVVLAPTPIAAPSAVKAALDACDDSPDGVRDAAILRILWATGARRSSITSMTFERLQKTKYGYIAVMTAKGGREIKALIQGHAAEALTRWLDHLRTKGVTRGAVWRLPNGATLLERDIWKLVRRRAEQAGVTERLTPHTFRVAFLTLNPAALDAKQDAAGHRDPSTTRLYDRAWRGRSAFESMPEVEDAKEFDDAD